MIMDPVSLPAIARDGGEAPPAQLVQGDSGRERLLLAQRPAGRPAQEEVEESLPRGRVVEGVARERRLAELADEVAQPLGRAGEPFEEERVQRTVAGGELGRVQVPKKRLPNGARRKE